MCKVLCVTNRRLCPDSLEKRIEAAARGGAWGILLREKDLAPDAYLTLARSVLTVCRDSGVRCILYDPQAARLLGADGVQLPMPVLRSLPADERRALPPIGASCHSVQEAQEAAALGASSLIAGHIFDTACKQGLPGRGLAFLRDVCKSTTLPVYAIGGITPDRMQDVCAAGAAGVCIMSSWMQCPDAQAHIAAFTRPVPPQEDSHAIG